MAPNPTIMQAVEQLGYRVTVGDVAAKAGLDVNFAQRELLTLASEAGGNLQVAESGDIAYLFPKNFRDILRNKFLRLQLQEWWQKIWRILFYLIRISFGVVLVASILLIFVAITLLLSSSSDNNGGGGGGGDGGGGNRGGGFFFFPYFWNDLLWIFYWNHDEPYYQRSRLTGQKTQMSFLEAVFSFLFGDGNPNHNLEERKWSDIATAIRNNRGAVAAEQIAPYLDNLGQGYSREYEEYMLPALARFDGRPEVSPEGQIVYHFPQLQTTATERNSEPVAAYLREMLWRFSQASSGQVMLAAGLGAVNIVGALVLGNLLAKSAIAGGFIGFVSAVYPMLLIYGVGFLAIPLIRYFWIQWKNSRIEARNQERQQRARLLNEPDANLLQKLAYAREFAGENLLTEEDLAYTTETELTQQELEQSAKIDAEWQRRIERSENL
ncbi:hypothetical protein QUA13_12970 [Microcoleus sp. S28C3]|uniref:hypothetical protein n=1 Tax=Microcoleus sp. S28C3 TaxID=3055414 RepID=UPI002FD36826